MRLLSFDPQPLRKHLLRHKIASLPELKSALGTNAALTVFSKTQALGLPLQLYPSRRYYALRETVRFDAAGDSMLRSKIPSLIWCTQRLRRSEVAGRFLDTSADGRHKLGISSAPGKPPKRFLWWPRLPHSRYLPMNSKRRFCFSTACWMSSSVVCLPGLESIKLGHGGDSILAEFLGLDPHTVARGRQQLLDQNVSTDRQRRSGGGRKLVEKTRRHRHAD